MLSLLGRAPVTDAQRKKNDQHSFLVVIAVLAVLFAYLYLFTHAYKILHLPAPQEVAERFQQSIPYVFDDDKNVDSIVYISLTQRFSSNDNERCCLYLVIIAAFLCSYFLPLRYKQPAILFWSATGISVLYGEKGICLLLLCHSIVYLLLHPQKDRFSPLTVLPGILAYLTWIASSANLPSWHSSFLILFPAIFYGTYHVGILRLLERPKIASVLQTAAIQSALITSFIGACVAGYNGESYKLPLGILLFFWQWERLIMYHIDYKDGHVPSSISFVDYLAVFLSPAMIPNWHWGVSIGQGYSYTYNNFLCEKKNKIVLSGVRILLLALGYLIFWKLLRNLAIEFFTNLGIPVYEARTRRLVRHFLKGGDVTTLSIWVTTFLDLVRWTIMWSGVVHFKVGVWRICGYRMDPYFNIPWSSTNLVVFWSRFTFHYREFLVRAFYYPVFFGLSRLGHRTRIVLATIAAAGIGNMIWGHFTEEMYYHQGLHGNVSAFFSTWPYYVLLSLGIAVTELYLLWRKSTRKPWTWGPQIFTDILAAYCTLQFYALISIFQHPVTGSSIMDLLKLFLIGIGL